MPFRNYILNNSDGTHAVCNRHAVSVLSSRPVYRMRAQVAPSGECWRGKGLPDRMLAKPWRRLFLAAYTLWAKPGCCCCPACVVSLLPCVAGCCMLYTARKVERFVLTIIKRWLLLLLLLLLLTMCDSGYGNAPPLTTGGRIFCVLYGLFGLPLFVVAAYGIGDQLVNGFDALRMRLYKGLFRRDANPAEKSV